MKVYIFFYQGFRVVYAIDKQELTNNNIKNEKF